MESKIKSIFKGIKGVILTNRTEGREELIIPASLTYKTREGEIFDYLVKELKFNEFIEDILIREIQGAENTTLNNKRLKQLKEDVINSFTEITIIINKINQQ